jgi:hypothetical protein
MDWNIRSRIRITIQMKLRKIEINDAEDSEAKPFINHLPRHIFAKGGEYQHFCQLPHVLSSLPIFPTQNPVTMWKHPFKDTIINA